MITIQTAMFAALGFLIASFLAVLLVPAYRARTVRLTSERVRAMLPTTEAELRADKDRIRADSALHIHRLESELARLRYDTAHRLVEIGRRDGEISTHASRIQELQNDLDTAQNARNVLEQTVADRLPKVEQRLIEAKKLLFQRDREIAKITEEAERTRKALVEAVQINTQQRAEIDRMSMVLDTRSAQNRDGLADPTFDAEVAMRSELEALRARTRDQASHIERLQKASGSAEISVPEAAEDVPEVVRLQRELLRAESALKAMNDASSVGQEEQAKAASLLRSRDQTIEDQAQEIARLKAAMAAYETAAEGGERALSIKDSKIAMKAKLSSLQVQTDAQSETIRKLRAEVAASNERLARQAQHFMEEMRRLGAGTLPASGQVRRPPSAAARRTLTQRITEAKPELVAGTAVRPVLVKSEVKPAESPPAASAAANGAVDTAATNAPSPVEDNVSGEAAASKVAPPARSRLVDRIAEYGKG